MGKVKNKKKFTLVAILIITLVSSLAFLNSSLKGTVYGSTDYYFPFEESTIDLRKIDNYTFEANMTLEGDSISRYDSEVAITPYFKAKDKDGKIVDIKTLDASVSITSNLGRMKNSQGAILGEIPLSDLANIDNNDLYYFEDLLPYYDEFIEVDILVTFDEDSEGNKALRGGSLTFNPTITHYMVAPEGRITPR